MIHLYSGDGKGKTSIAVGMSVRFAGAGGQVIFAQFMKGNESSELNIFREIPQVKVLKVESQFGFYSKMSDEEKKKITELHNDILSEIIECVNKNNENEEINKKSERSTVALGKTANDTDDCQRLLIVLDEITYPCRWKLIDEKLFKRFLKELPDTVELVMTGRNPLDYMVEASDYWSDVEMKKHPYEKGVSARLGIEY